MGVVVFAKVLRNAKSQSPRTLGVLGPLQKLLLPFIFHGSVPLLPASNVLIRIALQNWKNSTLQYIDE